MHGPTVVVSQRPMMTVNSNQTTLRRASYASVAELISPYQIESNALEEELDRAKEQKKKLEEVPESIQYDGVPTELDTSLSQKKLHPPRGGFNLCLLVGKVEVVVDKHRVDGSRVRLAEVLVGDETGCVSLRARDEQIDVLKEVSRRSGAIVLRNGTLELFQGRHIRLAVTKWGKLSLYPDQISSTPVPPSKMNVDKNFSMLDLVRVASTVSELVKSDEGEHRNDHNHQHQGNFPGRGHSNQGRRGGNRRNSSRGGKFGGYSSQGATQQQHLQQQMYANPSLQYPPPGGLHGYGTRFVEFPLHQMMQQHMYEMTHSPVPMYLPQQNRYRGESRTPAGRYRHGMHEATPQSLMGTPPVSYSRGPNESMPHDPSVSPVMNPRASTFDPSPRG